MNPYDLENYFWFGTRDYMQWLPCPAIDGSHSGVGYSDTVQYLNGGAFVRSSTTSHMEYSLSWNLTPRETLQPLYDYKNGIYGPGPIYFIDPFAADLNLLPSWWAAPGMALSDAPVLFGESRPSLVMNSDLSRKYPSRGANYLVSPGSVSQTIYIPIPPGKTLWLGAHGLPNEGSYVVATPFSGSLANAPVALNNMSTGTTVRCDTYLRSADGYTGVELSIAGSGSLTLFGLIAQLSNNSSTTFANPGNFIGGMGHSGCSFQGKPTKQAYSSALDLIGATATLIETEGWE